MSDAGKAVFLSYASQDAEAARRICDALRQAGIGVWFDQSELRGGDAWDQKIRRQIKECALFMPLISANTQSRPEGYFRLEWRLADQRTHLMGRNKAFLLPVCVDETLDTAADVPDSFLSVQWMRLPGGETSPAMVERVLRLLAGEGSMPPLPVARPSSASNPPIAAPAAEDKSVAVLAFANLSADKANEYFSDGISEELLNVLAKVPGLKVTARTSSFHFKGTNTAIPEIARQLGVAYVVEGSVRRAGDKVRIAAQLIKAADGFHVWSDTFTRDLKDIFAVQDEIAGLVAKQLSLKLGAGTAMVSVVVNPEAFELYLQGRQAWNLRSPEGFARAEQLLNRAIEIAPGFLRAQGALGDVAMMRDEDAGKLGAFRQRNSSELADLIAQFQRVLALDPDLAEAHASLGNAHTLGWNFTEGVQNFRRAIALNPNYATAHQWLAFPLFFTGWVDEALAEQQHAVELDPLSPRILDNLGHGLRRVGRYREALGTFDRALSLQPSWPEALGGKALAYVALGHFAEAVALARQLPADNPVTAGFQISVFGQAGLRAEAEALLARGTPAGNWSKVQLLLATGRREEALSALDASDERLYPEHSDVLLDPLFDPLRDDPRFVRFIATLGWTAAHVRSQAWRAAHPPEKPEARGQRTDDGEQKTGKTSGGGP